MTRWEPACGLVAPEVVRVPEPGQHHLVAAAQVRHQFLGRVLRRGREVERAADHERLGIRVAHAAVLVLTGACGPGVAQPATGPEELGAGVAQDRAAVGAGSEGGRGVAHVGAADGGDIAPGLGLGERDAGHQGLEPEPARVAVGGRLPGVDRQRARDRRRRGGRVHETEERGDARVAALDRQEPPVVGQMRIRRPHVGGEVAASLPAGVAARAQRRVVADLPVDRLRVPDEVAGRVGADHHGAVDAPRVAPGVDHGGTRAGTLADQVDALVAQRAPGGLEVVDPLGQRVAGEIDAVGAQVIRARPVAVRLRAQGLLAEQVGGVLQRRHHLAGSRARTIRRRRGSRRARRRGCRRSGSRSRSPCC